MTGTENGSSEPVSSCGGGWAPERNMLDTLLKFSARWPAITGDGSAVEQPNSLARLLPPPRAGLPHLRALRLDR